MFDQYGDPDVLHFAGRPDPVAGDGEVLIGIRAAGVNPVDWKIRKGLLASRMPSQFPITPGWDCAGDVLVCGAGVTRVAVGDRVFAYARKDRIQDGTYAERIALPESSVSRMPARLTFEEAASIPLAGLTSYQALFEAGGLTAGQTVLIHAGAGGTGGFAIQLARQAGARVLTTASARNHDYVRILGAHEVIDYTVEDFRVAVRRLCPEGVDLAYDTVGGETQLRSAEIVRKGGMIVSILAFTDEPSIQRLGVQTRYVFVRPMAAHLDYLRTLCDTGVLRTHVSTILSWREAAHAHELIQSGHTRGKIVLRID